MDGCYVLSGVVRLGRVVGERFLIVEGLLRGR